MFIRYIFTKIGLHLKKLILINYAGTDQPEAIGIEQLLHQLDSSGGLLPRAMRGDMLRPAWQFHGAENPLADRDESCYVCCALGESAFLGTFSCSLYLLQNLEVYRFYIYIFCIKYAQQYNITLT